ncbi:synaptobrevin [Beauveria brongniartii RCEF 3172]|uniref:Synaptobrevin n=1 Tax=Beauveria brongniartii RCEF 3172 TaxID=1081107 RepID=A0A167H2X5_9HYPO|nr:synaptobrevin [Beauveria brongniartii RCEF 3172]
MARESNSFGSTSGSIGIEAGELAQILSRLQDSVLHPTPQREKQLRRSYIEREKLATLEQDAAATPFKSSTGPLLAKQRDALELLLDRLKDLQQVAADEDELDDDSSDEEDLLGSFIPTPSQSAPSTAEDTDPQYTPPALDTEPDSPILQERSLSSPSPLPAPTPATTAPTEAAAPTPTPAPTQTTQTMRGRHGAEKTAASAAASHSSARAALFASRRKTAAPPQTSTATAEAILDQQRAEQDALSDSILKLAGALKASSHRFSSTLEADKEAVSRAGEGMSKTEQSMEAARGRMGTLRKMTEGKGWWGRMILYAWVYGLMVGLVLLVFVFPKLRF